VAVRLPQLYRYVARVVVWPIWRRYAHTSFGHALAVRLTHRSYDAFNRGDLDALRAMYHPDTVWDVSRFPEWPMQSIYRGYDGMEQLYNDWWEPWSRLLMEPAQVRVAMSPTGPRGVITLSMRGTGRGSGVEAALTLFQVADVRDGLVFRVVHYTSEQEAFEAARRGGAQDDHPAVEQRRVGLVKRGRRAVHAHGGRWRS
jgi:ketosteroid isomerase-like protein